LRILEAANANKNITNLNLGFVTDKGLFVMAKTLQNNKHLKKLKFTEHSEFPWCDSNKADFCDMLKKHKNLQKVKFDYDKDVCDHTLFKKEVNFYVNKIKDEHDYIDEVGQRKESCDPNYLFNNLLKMIEDKDDHEKMPVRKFFNNTFDTLINDAIFALIKKQSKSKTPFIHTMQGSIKFVAQFLQDHLPENEAEAMA